MVQAANSTRRTPPALDFGALVKEHGPKVRALALRLTGNAADADEVVQDTFLSAWKYRHTFRGDAKVSTWLYTIALRSAKRLRRQRGAAKQLVEVARADMPLAGGMLADPRAAESDPARKRLEREAVEAMEEAIPRLPEAFRVPLVLKDVAELPIAEVSRVLGVKAATVKTRVHRARMMLRSMLESSLPKRKVAAAVYPRQVCVDLLAAKQRSLDRGEAFPAEDVICDRCRAVFASLDLGRDLCGQLGKTVVPGHLRKRIMAKLEEAGAAGADGSR